MGTRLSREGAPSDDAIAFYARRAEGGVGLIVTGGTVAHPSAPDRDRLVWEAYDATKISKFAELVDAVHAHGAAVFGQLFHYGREWPPKSDQPLIGPSTISSTATKRTPHALTVGEIRSLVDGFAASAHNLRSAGYDGIELHAAHGYLISEFLSPQANRRQDDFGGTLEKRARFPLDIAAAIRGKSGTDFPLGIRISAVEEIDDGMQLEEAQGLAKIFCASGLFDYISVAIGTQGSYVKDMSNAHGLAVPLARAIREVSSVPVIASQRINQPGLAADIITSGSADIVGLARALIADPDWVRRAEEGQPERIIPCIGCLQECRGTNHLACLNNPRSARERTLPAVTDVRTRRAIAIVGGGPAGLEAARIAGERGHRVTLLERRSELGGQVRLAAKAPDRAEIDGVVSYRREELSRLGVEIRLATEATADMILAMGPDAVILATGAEPGVPNIFLEDVDSARVASLWDVYEGEAVQHARRSVSDPQPHAVVIDDGIGGWEGLSTAEYLAGQGFHVTFVTPGSQVGAAIPWESIPSLLRRLARSNVRLLPMTGVSSVGKGVVNVYDPHRFAATHRLEERSLDAALVVAVGPKVPCDRLAAALRESGVELHVIGDCLSPRTVSHAILEGHRVGLRV